MRCPRAALVIVVGLMVGLPGCLLFTEYMPAGYPARYHDKTSQELIDIFLTSDDPRKISWSTRALSSRAVFRLPREIEVPEEFTLTHEQLLRAMEQGAPRARQIIENAWGSTGSLWDTHLSLWLMLEIASRGADPARAYRVMERIPPEEDWDGLKQVYQSRLQSIRTAQRTSPNG